MITKYYVLLLIQLISMLNFNDATLTPKSPRANKDTKVETSKSISGPLDQSVIDRNLLNKFPSAKNILSNHQGYYKDTSDSNFEGVVLGYVTPWNNHGYDIAKLFGNKFTHISPVWLQIKRNANLKYEIKGTHDVDKDWVDHVKDAGRNRKLKIVPRLLFDGWTVKDYKALLNNEQEMQKLAETLLRCCRLYEFDGLVVEIWSQVAGNVNSNDLVNFIKFTASYLKENNLDFILVITPKRGNQVSFSSNHFEELYDSVTAFSLMTYDFSSIQRPGPNAPINWMEDCITYLAPDKSKRRKILTGLNFYGYVYTVNGGRSIVGHEYLTLLKHFKGKMEYDPDSAESYFEMSAPDGKYIVFYPTLHSINERLIMADKLGTGISIWEIGQGLDYFYDLL